MKNSNGKKILVYYTFLYILFNLFISNFVSLNVDESTLRGSATLSMNFLNNFSLMNIVVLLAVIITAYSLIKKYKWAEGIMFTISLINAFSSLLIIQTSNFSMYNIVLIISTVLSIVYLYILCRLESVRTYLKSK